MGSHEGVLKAKMSSLVQKVPEEQRDVLVQYVSSCALYPDICCWLLPQRVWLNVAIHREQQVMGRKYNMK